MTVLCDNFTEEGYADAETTTDGDASPRKSCPVAELMDGDFSPRKLFTAVEVATEGDVSPRKILSAALDFIQTPVKSTLFFNLPHVPQIEQQADHDSMLGVMPTPSHMCLQKPQTEKHSFSKGLGGFGSAHEVAPMLHAKILNFHEEGLGCTFDIAVSGAAVPLERMVKRCLTEFRHVHNEVQSVVAACTGQPLRFPTVCPLLVPSSFRHRLWRATSGELQKWLDRVMSIRLIARSPLLQTFLNLEEPPKLCSAQDSSRFAEATEGHLPIMGEIMRYIEAPIDLLNICTTSYFICEQDHCWEALFKMTWPAFHESLKDREKQDWRLMHHKMLNSQITCILEVFDREKSPEFRMSCVPAWVHWETKSDSYVAKYISTDPFVRSETIPRWEGHRLRFCPAVVRDRLQPHNACLPEEQPSSCWHGTQRASVARHLDYPYEPLKGIDDFKVGGGVELQWKTKDGSAFGWWHALLEKLAVDSHRRTAIATIVFPHFPANSDWYRLQVRFGDGHMRPCDFSGITGGLRPISEAEEQHWMQFFRPMDTLCC